MVTLRRSPVRLTLETTGRPSLGDRASQASSPINSGKSFKVVTVKLYGSAHRGRRDLYSVPGELGRVP